MFHYMNLTNNLNTKFKHQATYILLIIFLIFYTRFGYRNLIIIGNAWDEITYLIVGREIINGKIPYIDFWEIKTIYAFVPFVIANFFENEIFQ